jgi:cytidine deaminase
VRTQLVSASHERPVLTHSSCTETELECALWSRSDASVAPLRNARSLREADGRIKASGACCSQVSRACRTSCSSVSGARSGAVYPGGNVENAAYPEGVSAETSAVSAMAQAGERRIAEICVTGDGEDLCTPRRGCRPRIREFTDAETIVHVAGPEGVRAKFTLRRPVAGILGPGHLRTT